jgi:hypothetical protein
MRLSNLYASNRSKYTTTILDISLMLLICNGVRFAFSMLRHEPKTGRYAGKSQSTNLPYQARTKSTFYTRCQGIELIVPLGFFAITCGRRKRHELRA